MSKLFQFVLFWGMGIVLGLLIYTVAETPDGEIYHYILIGELFCAITYLAGNQPE